MTISRRDSLKIAAALAALGLMPGAAFAQEGEGPLTRTFSIGEEDAPVHIIEYASLTCPHCATFHTSVFPRLREEYVDGGQVRFEFREVYFDRLGLWGGMLARCGGGMRYFGIVDLLLKNQTAWSRAASPTDAVAELRRIGAQAGLTDEQMDSCLADAELAEALVAQYQEHMEEHAISGTPAFVINGRMHSNMSYDDFARLIDAELS